MPIIIITGGLGYIGSHISAALLEKGWQVVIIDNCSNSTVQTVKYIEESSNGHVTTFYNTDLRDRPKLDAIFQKHTTDIFAVIHCAGLKSVSDSVKNPLSFYDNNLQSTICLLQVMKKYSCKNIVFSSSATVYGYPKELPLTEASTVVPINPYGQAKAMIEQMLKDLYDSDTEWNICVLRYFNPIGAHPLGLLQDQPTGVPNNLMPFIVQVVQGKRECLQIFGGDYSTKDGTGVRDYIHILDLVNGHIQAIAKNCGYQIFNLGTGRGYSVLDIVKTVESLINKCIPYKIVPRRDGDVAIIYANCDLAKEFLGWEPQYGLREMCRDSLHIKKSRH